jgi:tetratricopeptide (TPR) repeat protein
MGAILRTTVFFVAGLAATFCAASARADTTTPTGSDWTALAKQASAAQSAGRLDEAADLLARARRMSPNDLGLLRSSCEVALAREQRTGTKVSNAVSSRAFCHSAYLRGGSPEDMRNEVASLVSPAEHPSLDDLVVAALNADAAVHSAPAEPWGHVARCDIARRLGSADVMETCLADLERQWPNHAATKEALLLGRESTSFVAWLVRALLILSVAGTLAHAWLAGRRSRRREATVPGKVAAALFVIVCVLSGAMAGAARAETAPAGDRGAAAPPGRRAPEIKRQSLSRFHIDDADPEGSLPDAKTLADGPLQYGYLLQDLAAKAQHAEKRGDHAAAIRYYRALAKITPKSPFAPRKLCDQLEATGDLATAVMACRTVLTLEGVTTQDYVHFVHLALTKSGQPTPEERKEIEAVTAHVAAEPNIGIAPIALRCDVALKFEDVKALESCTQELAKLAPKDPRTVSFQWALAIQKKQRSVALRLIDKAREVGVSTSGVTMMESETHRMVMRQVGRFALIGISAVAFGILLTMGFRHLKRRRLPA